MEFICTLVIAKGFSQVQSPEQYLGYKIGTRFTPHWKIADYFTYVAGKLSSRVSLLKYGQTNEGRPLLLAFIGTPENIKNLEAIRMNNNRLAGLSRDKMAPDESMPQVVWLSYNVHGDETSSSEASMLTLFALTDESDPKVKSWLSNTVVMIDPCLNPDGRDRYVNWFNAVVGNFVQSPSAIKRT